MNFYSQNLNFHDVGRLEDFFCETLVDTNYTYSFFVDWQKVTKNRDSFRNELALLSGLKGLSEPETYLRQLIAKYPEVVRAFPLLLAERERILKVLHSIKPDYQYIVYDFRGKRYSEFEIDRLVGLCPKSTGAHVTMSVAKGLRVAGIFECTLRFFVILPWKDSSE